MAKKKLADSIVLGDSEDYRTYGNKIINFLNASDLEKARTFVNDYDWLPQSARGKQKFWDEVRKAQGDFGNYFELLASGKSVEPLLEEVNEYLLGGICFQVDGPLGTKPTKDSDFYLGTLTSMGSPRDYLRELLMYFLVLGGARYVEQCVCKRFFLRNSRGRRRFCSRQCSCAYHNAVRLENGYFRELRKKKRQRKRARKRR